MEEDNTKITLGKTIENNPKSQKDNTLDEIYIKEIQNRITFYISEKFSFAKLQSGYRFRIFNSRLLNIGELYYCGLYCTTITKTNENVDIIFPDRLDYKKNIKFGTKLFYHIIPIVFWFMKLLLLILMLSLCILIQKINKPQRYIDIRDVYSSYFFWI